MIITGFVWKGDAAVHVSVEAGPMKLGRFPAGTDEPVGRLVRLVNEAGIRARKSPAICFRVVVQDPLQLRPQPTRGRDGRAVREPG